MKWICEDIEQTKRVSEGKEKGYKTGKLWRELLLLTTCKSPGNTQAGFSLGKYQPKP